MRPRRIGGERKDAGQTSASATGVKKEALFILSAQTEAWYRSRKELRICRAKKKKGTEYDALDSGEREIQEFWTSGSEAVLLCHFPGQEHCSAHRKKHREKLGSPRLIKIRSFRGDKKRGLGVRAKQTWTISQARTPTDQAKKS